jgi:hypothetical protein
MTELKPTTDRSVEFLQKFHPQGPWAVVSIAVDKKSIDGKMFMPGQETELKKWLDARVGKRNIYFHVNEPFDNYMVKGDKDNVPKAEKTDIKSSRWLHVDVDCEEGADINEEYDRILKLMTKDLPKNIPEPTVIIFSGGGYQAFWRLAEPFEIKGEQERWEKLESYNRRLEQIFGGDHCFNIDRIMRLPGTINIPNAIKIKKGRIEQLAKVISFKNVSYKLEDKFVSATPVQTSGPVVQDAAAASDINLEGSDEKILDLAELDKWDVPDRVKIIIAQGRHPDKPKSGDNSRSAWVFDVVCNLVRCKVPDGIIFSLLTDKEWGISDSVLEQKDPARYAIKQITSAHGFVRDPNMHYMNTRHAVIGNIGGKCRVIEEVPDDIIGRTRITYSSFEDLRNRYNNKKITVGHDKDGKPILVPLGTYWLASPDRQQFDFIKFMPDGAPKNVFNLWRGFAYGPKQGNCDLYLDHLRENICGGNPVYFDYLIKWMARAVQHPATQGQVAIVLRGGKGTGKSIMATVFGKLFGRHYLHIANPSHLVGNFNSHLRDSIVLFADEAFFAGDRKHESVLKMLITEDTIPIEQKHVDVEPYPNYVHLIMAANDPHVIRATGDERRYFVLNVGTAHQQDSKYFTDMLEQMENGGYEALLFLLQGIDLKGWQVRNVPQTEALQEQKALSLGVEEEWWFRKLRDGRILETDGKWEERVECSALIQDYIKYAEAWKISRRGNETSLGKFLNRVCPHIDRSQISLMKNVDDGEGYSVRKPIRTYVYNMGSLEKCREAWTRLNGNFNWPEATELDLGDGHDPF